MTAYTENPGFLLLSYSFSRKSYLA